MLTISDTRPSHTCGGATRRDFLRIGALSGLSLAGLLKVKAEASGTSSLVRDRSVVMLFLHGGPSHIEMFDPKMTAPDEYRAMFGEVQTRVPGLTFGSHFPLLAARADQLAVVRSYGGGTSNHTTYEYVAAGNREPTRTSTDFYNPSRATWGALYTRVAGTNHPATGMPRNALVLPEAIQPELRLPNAPSELDYVSSVVQAGTLGANYSAFEPTGGGALTDDMQLRLPPDRFNDRRTLLKSLDKLRVELDSRGAMDNADRYRQQAFDVIAGGGVARAFDLSQEDPRVVARYDTSRIFNQAEAQRYANMSRASNLLGKQLLLARRLCEAGCGFVTVSDCGWDTHGIRGRNPDGPLGGFSWLAPQVDHAVAAFLDDCRERGLSDKIVLIITGEMGRAPRINNTGSRDHHPDLTPLVFAGGGLNVGQVIGQSDARATLPATKPYGPKNLLTTIAHLLFDAAALRTANVPSEVVRVLTEAEPIEELY